MQMPEYFRVLSAFRSDWLKALPRGGGGAQCPIFLTAALQADFRRPSHQGEDLSLSLCVAKVGQRSLTVHVHGQVSQEERVWLREVLVAVDAQSLEPRFLSKELAAAARLYGASYRGGRT